MTPQLPEQVQLLSVYNTTLEQPEILYPLVKQSNYASKYSQNLTETQLLPTFSWEGTHVGANCLETGVFVVKITYFQNSSVVDSVTVLFPLSSYLVAANSRWFTYKLATTTRTFSKHTVHFSSAGGKKNTRNLLFLNFLGLWSAFFCHTFQF